MGTRTVPRRKAKRKRQLHLQRPRFETPDAEQKEEPTATCDQPDQPSQESQATRPNPASQANQPPASPAEAAKSWVQATASDSPIKQVAAAALILGENVSKTAAALGVDRRTIQRWRKFDPEFQQALHETRREVVVSSRQYLLAVAEAAVEVVENRLGEQQDSQVAISLLRGIGVLSPQSLELSLMEEADCESQEPTKKAEQGTESATKFGAQSATSTQPAKDTADKPRELNSPELKELSPAQQMAILGLYSGRPLVEVALLAKTTEAAVRDWLCHDPNFYNALSDLQFDRIHRLKHRLMALISEAMQIVRKAVQAGDHRIALALIRGMGLMC